MNIRQLWNNYKLVQWEDGTYGIRKGWLFHRFRDFSTTFYEYWWEQGDRWIVDCKTSKEKAEAFFRTSPRYAIVSKEKKYE